MKPRLLEFLRCPNCHSPFRLVSGQTHIVERSPAVGLAECSGLCSFSDLRRSMQDCSVCSLHEVMGGELVCRGCGGRCPVREGVPRFGLYRDKPETDEEVEGAADWESRRTAASFGYLWSRSPALISGQPTSHHFEVIRRRLSLPEPSGLILDAGCGEGIDVALLGGHPGVEVVGVELSPGGARMTFARSLMSPVAHIVQGDISRLPFASNQFDLVYAYGVLHHLPSPGQGLRELVRVTRPGGTVATYLYEDFSERSAFLRRALAAVNLLRMLTVRIPHRLLYFACFLLSPLVFGLLTVPSRILRHFPGTQRLAASIPYRHGSGPLSLVGDLYDRFSAPIEHRFSRVAAAEFFLAAGLERVILRWERGWILCGVKPEDLKRNPPS